MSIHIYPEVSTKLEQLLLDHSSWNPIHANKITSLIPEIRSDIILRAYVNYLRSQAMPICSSSDGYWMGIEAQDIYQTINDLSSRIAGITKAIEGLRYAAERIGSYHDCTSLYFIGI